MRIIIAGSRDFSDYVFLQTSMDAFASDTQVTVLSGTARGADRLGERWARSVGAPIERYPAQWSKYGKSAGVIRNVEMASAADTLALFWDGSSRGSAHMLSFAKKKGLDIHLFKF